ncbi:MAG: class I SAM-dependent methyltransferase [Bryobacteraceae bacterium]
MNAYWKAEDLESVGCDFCGGDSSRPICQRPDSLTVRECATCGLAFLNPRPRKALIERIYRDGYFESDRSGVGYRTYLPASFFPEIDLLESFRPVRGRRVVEIGCATGALLAELQRRGAEVCGVEPNLEAAKKAQELLQAPVYTGTIEMVAPADLARADVIVAFEVIEHVTSPRWFLERLRGLLKPGGQLVLTTPNYHCARRFGAAWCGFTQSFEHLYFLSDEVLSRMAHRIGLEEKMWYTRGDGSPISPAPAENSLPRRLLRELSRIPVVAEAKYRFRGPAYVPYGQGHTLLAIYEKPAAS